MVRNLHVVPELFPLVKTGGLADVASALPVALANLGADSRIVVPGYSRVLAAGGQLETVWTDSNLFRGGPAALRLGTVPGIGVPVYVLDCPGHFDRPGTPYLAPDGHDWPDNHLRFAGLCWVAARIALGDAGPWVPEVVHCHDWQAGLVPAYVAHAPGPRPATVQTVHNMAYQGVFDRHLFGVLGLPRSSLSVDGLEFYGRIGYLKAGLFYADRITTVSRTYAKEIQTPEQGFGLQGLLRTRAADLIGIVNGIDERVWDPARDPHLPRPYGIRDAREGKAAASAALRERMGLPPGEGGPLFAVVSRLSWHKGLDLMLEVVDILSDRGAQLVVLGTGEPALERAFLLAADARPDHLAVRLGYDEQLSHLIQGGADVIAVPSRTEPCGLTQLYGLRYGTLPMVRRTGGLADTVVNAEPDNIATGRATGFVFDDATPEAVAGTIDWVCDVHSDREAWRALQRTAMSRDVGWSSPAREYLALYRELVV